MATLNLRKTSPGCSPIKDKCFELLEPALQPESDVSVEKVLAEITKCLLPSNKFEKNVELFFVCIFEISGQIPYGHPLMDKLVNIFERFLSPDSLRHMETPEIKGEEVPHVLAQEISFWHETIRDGEGIEHTNMSSFLARLEAHGLPFRQDEPVTAEYAFCHFFERPDGRSFGARQACIMAATQWILFFGRRFFEFFLHLEQYPHIVHKQRYSLRRWQEYRHGFEAFARGDRDKSGSVYSSECRDLAARAAAEMLSFEQEAGIEDPAVE